VYNPLQTGEEVLCELDGFLDMVYNCAPDASIILAATYADERIPSRAEIDKIRARNRRSRIAKAVAVDSKSGFGMEALQQAV
jgi:hypothetical protein